MFECRNQVYINKIVNSSFELSNRYTFIYIHINNTNYIIKHHLIAVIILIMEIQLTYSLTVFEIKKNIIEPVYQTNSTKKKLIPSHNQKITTPIDIFNPSYFFL